MLQTGSTAVASSISSRSPKLTRPLSRESVISTMLITPPAGVEAEGVVQQPRYSSSGRSARSRFKARRMGPSRRAPIDDAGPDGVRDAGQLARGVDAGMHRLAGDELLSVGDAPDGVDEG